MTPTHPRNLLASLVLLAIATVNLMAFPMSYEFEKGASVDSRINFKFKMSQEMAGQNVEFATDTTTEVTVTVVDADKAGTGTMELRINSIKQDLVSPISPAEFDSNNPPENPDGLARLYIALIGKSFQYEVGPTGEIGKITGLDEMLAAALEEAKIEKKNEKRFVTRIMDYQYARSTFENYLASYIMKFPDPDAQILNGWKRTFIVDHLLPMKIEADDVVTSVGYKPETMLMTSRGAITIKDPNEKVTQGRLEIGYEFEGYEIKDARVERRIAWPYSLSSSQTIEGNSIIEADQTGLEPIIMPMKMDSLTTIERIE